MRIWLVILFSAPAFLIAQAPDWVQRMQDPDADFRETVRLFEEEWKDVPPDDRKHRGWKVFKRWEYFMERRLGPDGKQSGSVDVLREMEKYALSHPEFLSASKRNSTNGSWVSRGPDYLPFNDSGQPNGIGRLNVVAFHPSNSSIIFVGAASGGIWKSTNGGSGWSDLSSGLTRLGVSSIQIHPGRPDTIFIGTGDRDASDSPGYGVWWSTNGGSSWASRNSGMGNTIVNEILMNPADPNMMIAATSNSRIYRSTNLGSSWTQVFSGHNCKDLDMHPSGFDTLYAAGTNFYRSTDLGQTWTQVTSGLPAGASRYALATSSAQPNWLYLLSGTSSGLQGVYKSTDGGISFSTQTTSPNILGYNWDGLDASSQAWYDLTIAADPTDATHLFAAGINIWESTNSGSSWSITAYWNFGVLPAVHADHHHLAFIPATSTIFSCNDGGLYKSTNGGSSWTNLSAGLNIGQIYKIGVSGNRKDLAINGYQDNGTGYNRSSIWYTPVGGDGMECVIDYSDDNVMYTEIYYGTIYRSTDGGVYFAQIANSTFGAMNDLGGWVTPYKLHPSDANTMFVGRKQMWRTNNVKASPASNVTWTSISSFTGNFTVVDFDISRSNPDVVYVSRNGTQRFLKSTDATSASPTWTDLTSSLPVAVAPGDIEIHPTNPNKLWIALSNDIYISTDGGSTWTDYSGTLPSLSVNTIVFDRESPLQGMYAGMDVGVYYRDTTLSDWVSFSAGLPNAEVTELEIYYDSECRGKDLLIAGTYGRGLWESDLRDPGTLAPDACFTVEPGNSVCLGLPIGLKDESAYQPSAWAWTISPGTYSFSGGTSASSQNPAVRFTSAGTYSIKLVASNINGTDSLVNTSWITVSGSAASLPYSEDFESGNSCSITTNCGTTSCTIPGNWINSANGSGDDIDWRVDSAGTFTVNTGPSMDVNPGTMAGKYIYTESSACYGKVAWLESDCIDLTSAGSTDLGFHYHMYGATQGELHVDVFSKGAWVQDIMTPLSGNIGNAWNAASVSLDSYLGEVIKLRFRGITGDGDFSDMALDNIHVSSSLPLLNGQFDFQARKLSAEKIELSWLPGNALQGEKFFLEKQVASSVFTPLYAVDAGSESYSFIDSDLLPFENLYVLRVLRKDGNRQIVGWARIMEDKDWVLASVWPNPSSGRFTAAFLAREEMQMNVRVADLTGRVIFEREMRLMAGNNQLEIPLENEPDGVYLLQAGDRSLRIMKSGN